MSEDWTGDLMSLSLESHFLEVRYLFLDDLGFGLAACAISAFDLLGSSGLEERKLVFV